MPLVNLSHVTTYNYNQPAKFGEHRLMVRPRESYDQHLLSSELLIDPEPMDLRWLHDVFGNSVAIAGFERINAIAGLASSAGRPQVSANARVKS